MSFLATPHNASYLRGHRGPEQRAYRGGTITLALEWPWTTGRKEITWISGDILEQIRIDPERRQGFIVADGRRLERQVGFGVVHAAGTTAPDFVVFAEPGDTIILGARSLEGLNVRVDAQRKLLVPAGPLLAGATFAEVCA